MAPLTGPTRKPPAGEDPLGEAIRHETLGEMAATLGRLNNELVTALTRLEGARERLLAAGDDGENAAELAERWQRRHRTACEALWNVIIQRELCGLRRHDAFLESERVPHSVRILMGPASLARPAPDPRRSTQTSVQSQDPSTS